MGKLRDMYSASPLLFLLKALVASISVGISLFQLYTGAFGVLDAYLQRTIHVLPLMALSFLIKPTFPKLSVQKNALIDLPLALLSLGIGVYMVLNYDRLSTREWYWGPMTTTDISLGVLMIILTLESARRVVGPALPIVAIFFIAYALYGSHLPYPFTIKSPAPLMFVDHMFMTTQAIFGIPTGVSATFVFLFILFGAFMEQTGAGKFIIDFSMALVGRSTGGPAKVAVIASGLFGTVSGHSVANVYGTGTITIPLMKRMGFHRDYAGAVEAAASTGGQLMPPIMGAAAFIMAEMLGTDYLTVAVAACIPALLYYTALFFSCHISAVRLNLGASSDEVPSMKKILVEGAHFFIPLLVLIAVLVMGFSAFRAAFIAIVTLIVVANLRKSSRMTLRQYFEALADGAKQSTVIAVSCACAGIVVGVLDITGVGLKFVSIVTELSMGYEFLALVLVMASCLVLGMGVPTAPAYIVVAMIACPMLIQLGVVPIAAHMFVFYSALLSAITPPVALAAYAGAAISGGGVMRTGVLASRLGFVTFVVPYLFIYNPALLCQGPLWFIAFSTVTGFIGVLSAVFALEGYMFDRLKVYNRLVLLALGFCLMHHSIPLNVAALAGFLALAFVLRRQGRLAREAVQPA